MAEREGAGGQVNPAAEGRGSWPGAGQRCRVPGRRREVDLRECWCLDGGPGDKTVYDRIFRKMKSLVFFFLNSESCVKAGCAAFHIGTPVVLL